MSWPSSSFEVNSAVAQANTISSYLYLASVIVPFYDLILNIDFEAEFIWPALSTRTAKLYLWNRYGYLIGHGTTVILLYFNPYDPDPQTCSTIVRADSWCMVIGATPTLIFLVRRATAVWTGNVAVSKGLTYYLAATFVVAIACLGEAASKIDFVPTAYSIRNYKVGCNYGIIVFGASPAAYLLIAAFALFSAVVYGFILFPTLQKYMKSRTYLVSVVAQAAVIAFLVQIGKFISNLFSDSCDVTESL